MTDDTTTDRPEASTDAEPTDDDRDPATPDPEPATGDDWDDPDPGASTVLPGSGDSTVSKAAYWALLVGTGFTALFAFVGFYTQVQRAIRLWVAPKYQPIVLAAFSLVVFLVALIGASLSVRSLVGENAG